MERTQDRSLTPTMIRRAAVALAISAFAVAACGPGGATTAPTTGVTTAPATTAPTTAATTPPASDAPASMAAAITLELATADVGEYVAGEDGMALYIFTPDAAAPGKSVCNDDCATAWPPLVVEDIAEVAAGTGVTGELGTVTRDDGTTQVTLGGNPLYYFANDTAAGDTNGQGLNDVWYLAAPDGTGIDAPQTGGGRDY
jgi:predicted lipoprotein with Yx(FWY)xxD motif